MSLLSKLASSMSGAALLVMLSHSVAIADQIPGSSGQHNAGSPEVCVPKPTKPNYPAEAGSPSCCTKPNTWQVRYSGGILKQPKKYFWACAPVLRPPP